MESRLRTEPSTSAMITFLGSYFFSVSLTVLIHEVGHAIALFVFGYPDINLKVTPFYGGTTSSADLSLNNEVFIIAAGPFFDLFCASIITISLWHKRSTRLLPLLMYGGTAFLLEGVVMFNTFFTSAGITDWDALIYLGLSPILIAVLTFIVLIIGSIFMYILWPLTNIFVYDSFLKKLYINSGYILYLILSIVFSIIINILSLPELWYLIILNAIVAVGFLIVRIIAYKPIFPIIDRITHTKVHDYKYKDIWFPLILGVVMFSLLIFLLN
jgi:hypothetical protein